jgi:uncharacterized protein DUF6174
VHRRVLLVAALGTGLLLGACSPDPEPAPQVSAPSEESSTASSSTSVGAGYTYVLVSSCGERSLLGTFSVTVTDGQVASAEGLDDAGKAFASTPSALQDLPTIEELTARAVQESPTDVAYDAQTGILSMVAFDPAPNSIDDEECYIVGGYTPVD